MSARNMVVLIGAVVALGLMVFNNCSDVGFQNLPSDTLNSSSQSANSYNSGSTSSSNTDGTSTALTESQIETVINTIPESHIENPVPITELEQDPTLFEIYKCPTSDGVLICHFPENVDAQATQCIGRPAVSTHYNHIRIYTLNGVKKTIGDYLGPCRISL